LLDEGGKATLSAFKSPHISYKPVTIPIFHGEPNACPSKNWPAFALALFHGKV